MDHACGTRVSQWEKLKSTRAALIGSTASSIPQVNDGGRLRCALRVTWFISQERRIAYVPGSLSD